MNPLLTAAELANDLRLHAETIRQWHRAGRIKAELLVGRSPRFDLAAVRKQLAAASAAAAKRRFSGLVPTL